LEKFFEKLLEKELKIYANFSEFIGNKVTLSGRLKVELTPTLRKSWQKKKT